MFAGHVGAALGLARVERRLNPGIIVLAALLLDVIFWLLVLAGLERVVIPQDYSRGHYLLFEFPYSHGLAAVCVWSALAAAATYRWLGRSNARTWRRRAAVVMGLAVFSHFLLDATVHVPEMPLLGSHSAKVGFGLWKHLGLALTLETVLTLGGCAVFLRGAGWTRARAMTLWAVAALVTALTVIGQTATTAPPRASVLAGTGLASIVLLAASVGWLGWQPTVEGARSGGSQPRATAGPGR